MADWNSDTQLPGRLFDAVPHNVMQTADGSYTVIDTEWSLSEGVSLGHLLFRAMLLTLSGMSRVGIPADPAIHCRKDFVNRAMACAGLNVTDEQTQAWMQLEAKLQSAVTAYPPERFLDWGPERPLPTLALSQSTYDKLGQESRHHSDLAQHHERLLVQALEGKKAIEHSTSWRLTAPIRALLNAIRTR